MRILLYVDFRVTIGTASQASTFLLFSTGVPTRSEEFLDTAVAVSCSGTFISRLRHPEAHREPGFYSRSSLTSKGPVVGMEVFLRHENIPDSTRRSWEFDHAELTANHHRNGFLPRSYD